MPRSSGSRYARSAGQEWYLSRLPGDPEADLLLQLNERIQDTDPDVIEGHNFFNFDVPFTDRTGRAPWRDAPLGP